MIINLPYITNNSNMEWLVFFIVGLLITVLAYLIKYKKQAGIISGYDENLVADKDGLCNWFGGVMLWLGFITFLVSFLLWWWPNRNIIIVPIFGICTVACCIIAIAGSKKYRKKV